MRHFLNNFWFFQKPSEKRTIFKRWDWLSSDSVQFSIKVLFLPKSSKPKSNHEWNCSSPVVRRAKSLAKRSPFWIYGSTHAKSWWNFELDALGVWNSRQKKHALGWRNLQRPNDFQRWLSFDSSQSQVCSPTFSSYCLPFWNCLLIASWRGKRLETGHHNQTNSLGHPSKLCILLNFRRSWKQFYLFFVS